MTAHAILFIDDHPLYREGLVRALGEGLPGLIVHAVDALPGARAVLRAREIDLVVADYRLASGDGVEAVRAIREAWPSVACALITGEPTPELSRRARQAGAVALLSKTRDVQSLGEAIAAILAGASVYDDGGSADGGLTERRLDILQRASRGQSNKEIASALGVSERTVKDHWTHILDRLGAENRTAAVGLALRQGLISRRD